MDSVHQVSPSVIEQVGRTAKCVPGHASEYVNMKDSFCGFTDVYRVTVDVLLMAMSFTWENRGKDILCLCP